MTETSTTTFEALKIRTENVLSNIEAVLGLPDEADVLESETIDGQLKSILSLLEGSKDAPGLVSRVDQTEAENLEQAIKLDDLAIGMGEAKLLMQSIQMNMRSLQTTYDGLNARLEMLKADMGQILLYRPAKHNVDMT